MKMSRQVEFIQVQESNGPDADLGWRWRTRNTLMATWGRRSLLSMSPRPRVAMSVFHVLYVL
jgi:hypothetical protein